MPITITDVELPAAQPNDTPSLELSQTPKVSDTSASYNNSQVSEAVTSLPVRVSLHGHVIKAHKCLIENFDFSTVVAITSFYSLKKRKVS